MATKLQTEDNHKSSTPGIRKRNRQNVMKSLLNKTIKSSKGKDGSQGIYFDSDDESDFYAKKNKKDIISEDPCNSTPEIVVTDVWTEDVSECNEKEESNRSCQMKYISISQNALPKYSYNPTKELREKISNTALLKSKKAQQSSEKKSVFLPKSDHSLPDLSYEQEDDQDSNSEAYIEAPEQSEPIKKPKKCIYKTRAQRNKDKRKLQNKKREMEEAKRKELNSQIYRISDIIKDIDSKNEISKRAFKEKKEHREKRRLNNLDYVELYDNDRTIPISLQTSKQPQLINTIPHGTPVKNFIKHLRGKGYIPKHINKQKSKSLPKTKTVMSRYMKVSD